MFLDLASAGSHDMSGSHAASFSAQLQRVGSDATAGHASVGLSLSLRGDPRTYRSGIAPCRSRLAPHPGT